MKNLTESMKIITMFCVAIVLMTAFYNEVAAQGAPDMPPGIANALKNNGKGDTAILLFVDGKTGGISMQKNPNYNSKTPGSTESASLIKKVNSISVVEFTQNPTCYWVETNGSQQLICEKN